MIVSKKSMRAPLDATELRLEFDRIFAEPNRIQIPDIEDFLAIRVGVRPFALRVNELARIEVDVKLVALPGRNSWLLGLANCQGKLIPVHSLELALGFDRTSGEKSWLAIYGRDEPLGLAFDALEGYLRIARSDVFSMGGVESMPRRDQQAVRGCGELRPVVQLSSIATAVRNRVSSSSAVEED